MKPLYLVILLIGAAMESCAVERVGGFCGGRKFCSFGTFCCDYNVGMCCIPNFQCCQERRMNFCCTQKNNRRRYFPGIPATEVI